MLENKIPIGFISDVNALLSFFGGGGGGIISCSNRQNSFHIHRLQLYNSRDSVIKQHKNLE